LGHVESETMNSQVDIADNASLFPRVADVPHSAQRLRDALVAQRENTFALYRELPESYWTPSQFPQMAIVNPPLWELAHIAYFAEYFCLRWQPDDPLCKKTPSSWRVADALFNSNTVPHKDRWTNVYPPKSECVDYMRDVLARVLNALEQDSLKREHEWLARRHLYQLVLLHEDMHAEALLMTLNALDLPLPDAYEAEKQYLNGRLGPRKLRANRGVSGIDSSSVAPVFVFPAGNFLHAASDRGFRFDNEMPAQRVDIAAFEIDARPVSHAEFLRWRDGSVSSSDAGTQPAMHITHAEATAYAHAHGRRLPTEAEWEYAAMRGTQESNAFWQSAGDVWEWTSSVFAPFPGFVAGAYAEYSAPWFPEHGVTHMVLKGGSFATHPRMKYPQYRNFFTPDRRDMFCGFRTCRSVD
jgi:gamma-glutamyl hercynylcysteine S-oxide synthase